jgi:predicted DNA-binding transcriptional regulator AlpA
MRANAVKTEDSFRNEEVPTIGSNSKSGSVPIFAEPGQEFHVISRNPKTADQRQDPSNILALRPKAKHEPLLNAREVANKLGVSERWVRDHTTRRSPRIRAVKLGPLVRYRPDDVEMFMDSLDTLRSSRDPQFRV